MKDMFKDVPLTPAPNLNGKGFSAGNTNQFSLGDMSDEEWTCFLSCFNSLLEESLESRSNQNVNFSRQRLGDLLSVMILCHIFSFKCF